MDELQPGEAMLVMATDPEAPIDLAAWAQAEGHGYEERSGAGWTEFVIRKSS